MRSCFTMIITPKMPRNGIVFISWSSKLKNKGVPINGVGLQGHWSIYEPSAEELEMSINRFASLGLAVQITELDVSVYPKEHERRARKETDTSEFTPEMDDKQAAHYKMLFEVFRKAQGYRHERNLLECG